MKTTTIKRLASEIISALVVMVEILDGIWTKKLKGKHFTVSYFCGLYIVITLFDAVFYCTSSYSPYKPTPHFV